MSFSECECVGKENFIPDDLVEIRRKKYGLLRKQHEEIIRFETVEVGTRKCLSISLENESMKDNTFHVTRDPNTNPIYQVFGVNIYKLKVPPSSTGTIKVFYKPLFPNATDIDRFDIIDSFGQERCFKMHGSSIGPVINPSTKFIHFITTNIMMKKKSVIELWNYSKVPAHFYIDMEMSIFTVDPESGTVPGNHCAYLTVYFEPRDYGTFCRQLNILLLHHDPVIIQLLGIHTPKKYLEKYDFLRHPKDDILEGFIKYMMDVQTCLKENPLFSLSETYMDFGSQTNNLKNSNKSLATSLTNHSSDPVDIIWEQCKSFKIHPEKVEIPPSDSVLFECAFYPDNADNFFSNTLNGNLFWKETNEKVATFKRIHVPFTLCLRAIGNSFAPNSTWLPQLDVIPEVVILPPTVPHAPAFITIQLKSNGYLPVSYSFSPPEKTNFIVKPMIGLVQGSKFVVVQLQAESRQESKVYVEQWRIILNSRLDNYIPFYVKGFSELPNALVGVDNRVAFEPVLLGCITTCKVPLKNLCQHYLGYKFIIDTEIPLKIKAETGEITGHDETQLEWIYFSNRKGCIKHEIILLLFILNGPTKNTQPAEIPIQVYIQCSTSELCSTPKLLNAGNIICHILYHSTFDIFNYGTAIIHYTLLKSHKCSIVNVMPVVGTIIPGGHVKVIVEFTPEVVGSYEINVFYAIRLDEEKVECVQETKKLIYSITYEASYPSIQIFDIMSHNFGPLFNNITLWELLDVDSINDALSKVTKEKSISVFVTLPENEMSDDVYTMDFALKNLSKFPSSIQLKRRKICECALKTYSTSISLRTKRYDCPHRDMVHLSTSDNMIPPKSNLILKMNFKYGIAGLTHVSYIIEMSHQRCVVLNFRMNSIIPTVKSLSFFNNSLKMELHPVCLDEKYPCLQVFWIYNNSRNPVNYDLDVNEYEMLNNEMGVDILKCLNPSGTVLEYSCLPLLFSFLPITTNKFYMNIPIQLGDDSANLYVLGSGERKLKNYNPNRPIKKLYFYCSDYPIVLSDNYLFIDPFPTWSWTNRVIFIRNDSKTSNIGYSWKSVDIEDVVEVKVRHRKGVLKPLEKHPLTIEIRSYKKPCKIRLQLACKLLNHNEYYQHKKSVAEYNAKQKELAGEFTITEKGTFVPKNDVEVKPFPKFFYVSVAIDLFITSIADRDLHYPPFNQLLHSPQPKLDVCEVSVFETSQPQEDILDRPFRKCTNWASKTSIFPKESEISIKSIKSEPPTPPACKNVLECMIADALFSNMFQEILLMALKRPQIYYKDLKRSIDNRKLKCFKDPSLPKLAEIIGNLTTDSLFEIFKLAPQLKERCSLK